MHKFLEFRYSFSKKSYSTLNIALNQYSSACTIVESETIYAARARARARAHIRGSAPQASPAAVVLNFASQTYDL